jgi:hypothetical protein
MRSTPRSRSLRKVPRRLGRRPWTHSPRRASSSPGFLSWILYQSCYSISYGVVFPSVLLARSIPKDNAAVNGLIDGAHAAMDMVEGMRSKPAS